MNQFDDVGRRIYNSIAISITPNGGLKALTWRQANALLQKCNVPLRECKGYPQGEAWERFWWSGAREDFYRKH